MGNGLHSDWLYRVVEDAVAVPLGEKRSTTVSILPIKKYGEASSWSLASLQAQDSPDSRLRVSVTATCEMSVANDLSELEQMSRVRSLVRSRPRSSNWHGCKRSTTPN